jgi:hypothetical protein
MEKAFNKIKTPLFSKRHVFNSNHMQVFTNSIVSILDSTIGLFD